MIKSLLEQVKNVLNQVVSWTTLLLHDAWTGKRNEELFISGLSHSNLSDDPEE